MEEKATQFSIGMGTKNRLDRYKAAHKEAIMEKFKADRRMVTNTMAIEYLLEQVGAEK